MSTTATERLRDEWIAKHSVGTVLESLGRPLGPAAELTPEGEPWHAAVWVSVTGPFGLERMTRGVSEIELGRVEPSFVPRTSLGTKLSRLRRRAIRDGLELWDQDTILIEVSKNRGERNNEEDVR